MQVGIVDASVFGTADRLVGLEVWWRFNEFKGGFDAASVFSDWLCKTMGYPIQLVQKSFMI